MKKRWILLILAVLIGWTLWANTAIEVNEWVIDSGKLPESFDGFRIAQVSDLHNAEFGVENEKLLALLAECGPDIIVLTGDLVDSSKTDIAVALDFAERSTEIAPCYYVSGNHEAASGQWPELQQGLTAAGVTILQDGGITLERDDGQITLIGLSDPSFGADSARILEDWTGGENYTILLSHRPELLRFYAGYGIDLVFSGHAHGGQFRIPFVGGLVAPGQGFFPEYDSGLYHSGTTAMLVSRGLGNSIIPIRINNRPEIILAVLKTA